MDILWHYLCSLTIKHTTSLKSVMLQSSSSAAGGTAGVQPPVRLMEAVMEKIKQLSVRPLQAAARATEGGVLHFSSILTEDFLASGWDDHRQIQTTSHDHVEDKHILAAGGHSPGWGARLRAAQLNMLWMGESVVGLQPTVLLSEPLDFLHQRLVHWVFLDQTVDLILKHVGHKMDVQSTLS